MFWEMAVEERSHHAMLERKYWEQYGVPERLYTEDELVELIEVPTLHEGEVFAVAGSLAARQQALQVALRAEVSAQQFYSKLVERRLLTVTLRRRIRNWRRWRTGTSRSWKRSWRKMRPGEPTVH